MNKRRRLELTEDQAYDLMVGDSEEFEVVYGPEIYDTSRWYIYYELVFKDKEGSFWQYSYGRGATEYQDSPDPELVAYEVFPREVTKVIYE